jgi:transcriptional regulator with XRE-family HTH domain
MSSKSEQAQIISNNIKELRNKSGWNQTKLASEAGISGAALSKIEQGEQRVPTIVVLRKLAEALNVEIHEITGAQPLERSEAEERNTEFYRKFGVIENLPKSDQDMLLNMAERLKGITGK